MMNSVAQLSVSTSLLIGSVTAYLKLKTYQNLKRHNQSIEDLMARDNTREEQEYFGLNWGSAADILMKDDLDTGDLLLIKYECEQSIGLQDMLTCYHH
jgi:hypothetical protein